ncbi:MAG: L-2-hydroxyglutarate oxidase [Candidatus Limnocylindria bacterium]
MLPASPPAGPRAGPSVPASASAPTMPALPGRVDVAVIGGGILGLAVARELLARRPALRLAVLEREAALALHQTGHNSGVLHAGLYYPPGSRKAVYCREGKAALEAYATERGIPFERCGKLVVALDETELPALARLEERATANRVAGLERVGPERIREIEPHVLGIAGLWSPGTGIIDFRRVALAYADDVRAAGGTIHTGHEVSGLASDATGSTVTTRHGELRASLVVSCAGLWADRVAAMTPGAGSERIVPFRGDYYTLTPDARALVRGLIYPVPDPRFPFLGVHFTRRIDGEVWAGPNAVLAFARTGYRRRDISPLDLARTVTSRGFLRLATRYWRTGAAEMWRDWSKRAFLAELRRFVPELRADQLTFGPSGIRAQAVDLDGSMVDDFRFRGVDRVIHVVNAPSPAATSSMAIAADIADRATERLGT